MSKRSDFFIMPKSGVLEKEIGDPFNVYCYLASKTLYDSQKGHDYSALERILFEPPFSEKQFNRLSFQRFLDDHFLNVWGGYALSDSASAKLQQTLSAIYDFGVYKNRDVNEIKSRLVKGLKNNSLAFPDALILTLTLKSGLESKLNIYWEGLFFSSISNLSVYSSSLSDPLADVEKNHPDISLSSFLPKFENDILCEAGILTFGDLQKLSSFVVLALFSGDEDRLISVCEGIRDVQTEIKGSFDFLFSSLGDREKDIIERRLGMGSSREEETLEAVGSIYGLTRERIRQIQSKSLRAIAPNAPDFLTKLKVAYVLFREPGADFISFEEFDKNIGVPEFSQHVSALYQGFRKVFSKSEIGVSPEYRFFCENGQNHVIEIKDRVLSSLGSVVSDADYSELGFVEKRIVDSSYYHRGTTWLHRGYKSSDLMADIVENVFPEGINPDSAEQFNVFYDIWTNQYGMDPVKPTRLRSVIEHDKQRFVAKDKGVWISSASVSDLSDDLFFKISQYISEAGTPIFYATIFEHFKDELVDSGIPNRYRLKTLFDRRDETYIHKRDYLSGSHSENTEKLITAFADEQDGVVTLKDLQQRFPGTSYSSFTYSLGKNNYLALSGERFLNYGKANIDEADREELHDCIKQLLDASPTNVVAQSRVFAMLQLWHPQWLAKHAYILTFFDLSSVITHFLSTDFQCFRHMIYRAGDDTALAYEMLIGYCSKQPIVTVKMIQNFFAKTGIVQNRTFSSIFSDLAETHMQFLSDRLVQVTTLNITDEKKAEISRVLGSVTDSLGGIDTRYFQSYAILPVCGFVWSKFSLLGFVRSFLGSEFAVEILDTDYRTLNYIIRRIVHE